MTTKRASKPLLVDNSINKAFAVKNFIYMLFGISGIVTHIPSVSLIAGEAIATVLAGIIAVSSAVASVCAWNFLKSERWQRWELYSTITMLSFVVVYVGALIYLAAIGEGNRINLAIIATALLVMPLWRARFILRKNRK